MNIRSRKNIVGLLFVLGIAAIIVSTRSPQSTADKLLAAQRERCLSTFPDGDGPYYKQNTPFRSGLAPDGAAGQKIIVSGKVFARGCKQVRSDVVIDIWQADPTGVYHDTAYRGRITTSRTGDYTFETHMPKGYGEGTGYRPPHIHFKVWSGNNLIITSEMFFPDVVGWTDDAYIAKVEKKAVNGQDVLYAYHDIILP